MGSDSSLSKMRPRDALQGEAAMMRRHIANFLVSLARRIDPENEQVMKFWMDRMVEFVLTGKSTIKVSSVAEDDMRNQS